MVIETLLRAPPAVYGMAIGVVATFVVALILPRGQRRLVRGPLLLFALYGAVRSRAEFFPPTDVVPKAPRFIAAFAWCAALVRMGFALFSSRYVTRFVRPWPKVMRVVVQAVIYFGVTLVALRAASRATPSKEFGSFSRISAASLDGHHTSIHIHVWLTR